MAALVLLSTLLHRDRLRERSGLKLKNGLLNGRYCAQGDGMLLRPSACLVLFLIRLFVVGSCITLRYASRYEAVCGPARDLPTPSHQWQAPSMSLPKFSWLRGHHHNLVFLGRSRSPPFNSACGVTSTTWATTWGLARALSVPYLTSLVTPGLTILVNMFVCMLMYLQLMLLKWSGSFCP